MIRRPPRSTQSRSSAASDVYKRQIRYIDQAYQDGVSSADRAAAVQKMSSREADVRAAAMTNGYGPANNNPRDLLAIMPHCYNVHGKFYEMTDELQEYSIPYETVMPVFIEGGYS